MFNQNLVKIFRELAFFLEMEETAFKPRAYLKAADSLDSLSEGTTEIYKKGGIKSLEEIPGVGRGIAEKIEEYLKSGKIKEYEKLKKKYPVDINGLNKIEGVGSKIIKLLYENLKIKNMEELRRSAKKGALENLPHFGKKLQTKILKSIEFQKKSAGRILLNVALPMALKIKNELLKIAGGRRVEICGSLRRKKELVGDIDILILSHAPGKAMDAFTNFPEVESIYAKGKTKTLVRLKAGIDADLRAVPEKSFGAALQYFTGNKAHNIALRKIAAQKGYKLNEYGLFQIKKDKDKKWKQIAGKTEEEIYEKLKMDFIPPELREDNGEIEAAQSHALPKLIELTDIKGDLQIQTSWTDGADSIEEMAKKARDLKYEYIAITDHTKSLAMIHGSDEKKLLKQIKEIENINSKLGGATSNISKFKILSGAEVNILKDGSLDINNDTLQKLDFAGAAVHSHFHLSKMEQTERLIKAMENEHIDIIFHPTGRIIYKREPIELDLKKIFEAAARTKTILEINGYPERLDLKDECIRLAKKYNIKFIINTDAHSANNMDFMEYGVFTARRGGLQKNDVLNALSLQEFLKLIKKPKNKRW